MTPTPYNFFPATTDEVPLLISVPHCGTEFPADLKDQFNKNLIIAPDDTDWFVDKLYGFAPAMGMAMITARYSRWVIDLNRDPNNNPLYSDGRIITALCPATTFLGEFLYEDQRKIVSDAETARRRSLYFADYHTKIDEELNRLKKKFGVVLLWDCHSIRQVVKTVYPEKIPDLILGDADGTSAHSDLIGVALEHLGSSNYSLSHNHPFKGGYITRHFGEPTSRQHALQLEMTKVNYMDRGENNYDERAAAEIQMLLKETFAKLIQKLKIVSLSSSVS